MRLKTNKELGIYIASLYKKNGCWTWFNNWRWYKKESFIKDNAIDEHIKKYVYLFPWNLMNFKFSGGSRSKGKLLRLLTPKANTYQ